MAVLIPKISIKRELQEEAEYTHKVHAQYHVHPEGESGASNLAGSCNWLYVLKKAGIELPEVEGLRNNRSALDVSTQRHETRQEQLTKKYEREPRLFIKYKPEVYIEAEVEGLKVKTPIDVPYVQVESDDKPGFIKKPVQFANMEEEMWFKHPDATWHQIIDFKFPGTFGILKIINKAKELEEQGEPTWKALSFKYMAQGHFEMYATGLKEITFYFESKESGIQLSIEIDLPWVDSIWERVKVEVKRRQELVDLLKAEKYDKIELRKSDLGCLAKLINRDEPFSSIGWRSCPLAKTLERESKRDKGKMIVALVKYCDYANFFLLEDAKERFTVDDIDVKNRDRRNPAHYPWLAGKSHCFIKQVDWKEGMVYLQNKGGTIYSYTFIDALKTLKPR